jgi:hypothetical protein
LKEKNFIEINPKQIHKSKTAAQNIYNSYSNLETENIIIDTEESWNPFMKNNNSNGDLKTIHNKRVLSRGVTNYNYGS